MSREKIIVAIHGILTGETKKGWTHQFEHWLWQHQSGVFKFFDREYFGGVFPVWNVFVRNKWIAAGLADCIEPYMQDGAEVSFVTHSNGADVGVEVIKSLANRDLPTRTLVCIGAAIQPDIERSGIGKLIENSLLGRAVAYCSPNDRALALKVRWPYGDLGRRGFYSEGVPFENERIQTKWFPDFGHSTYFDAKHRDAIFESIIRDITAAEVQVQ